MSIFVFLSFVTRSCNVQTEVQLAWYPGHREFPTNITIGNYINLHPVKFRMKWDYLNRGKLVDSLLGI